MADIAAKLVMELRQATGISMMECKKALIESNGNIDEAIKILKERGLAMAQKKQDRETKEGVIGSYLHANNKVGVMVELNCETDFVAKNEEFISLAKELAMQVCAMNPIAVSEDQIAQEDIEDQKKIFLAQMKDSDKPENVLEKIVDGKLKKYFSELCLIEQVYIKDNSKKIKDLINEQIQKLGENITVGKFIRYEI